MLYYLSTETRVSIQADQFYVDRANVKASWFLLSSRKILFNIFFDATKHTMLPIVLTEGAVHECMAQPPVLLYCIFERNCCFL